jgi:hypothetical protein
VEYKKGDKVVLKSLSALEKEFGKNVNGEINTRTPLLSGMQDILRDIEVSGEAFVVIKHTGGSSSFQFGESSFAWPLEIIEYSLEEKLDEYKIRPTVTRFDLIDFSD